MSDASQGPEGPNNYRPLAVIVPDKSAQADAGKKRSFFGKNAPDYAPPPAEPTLANVNLSTGFDRKVRLAVDAMNFFHATPDIVKWAQDGNDHAKKYLETAIASQRAAFENRGWPRQAFTILVDTMKAMLKRNMEPEVFAEATRAFREIFSEKANNPYFDFESSECYKKESKFDRHPDSITGIEIFKVCDAWRLQAGPETASTADARARDAAASMQPASGVTGLGIGSANDKKYEFMNKIPKTDAYGGVGGEFTNIRDASATEVAYYHWLADNYSKAPQSALQWVTKGQWGELGKAYKIVAEFSTSKDTKWVFNAGQINGAIAAGGAALLLWFPLAKVLPDAVSLWFTASATLTVVSTAAWQGFKIGAKAIDSIFVWDFRQKFAIPDKAGEVVQGASWGLSASLALQGIKETMNYFGALPALRPSSVFLPDSLNNLISFPTASTFAQVVAPIVAGVIIGGGYQLNHEAIPAKSGGGDATENMNLKPYVAMDRNKVRRIIGATAAYILAVTALDWIQHAVAFSSHTQPAASPAASPSTPATPTPIQNKGGANDPSTPGPKRESPADMDPFKELREQREQQKLKEQQQLKPGNRGGQNQIDRFNGSQMGMKDAAKVAGQQLAQRFKVQLPGGRIAIAFVPSREDVQGSGSSAPLRNYART